MDRSDFVYIINEKVSSCDLYDALSERIEKAESLMRFSLTEAVYNNVSEDIGNYLLVLSDLLKEIKELNQQLMKGHQNFLQEWMRRRDSLNKV